MVWDKIQVGMHQSDNGSDIVPILTQKVGSDTISDAIGDNKLIHSVQFYAAPCLLSHTTATTSVLGDTYTQPG